MSQNTSIEWTDCTWPCVRGCSKVSPGCKFCWAIRDAHLHAGNPNPKMQAHFGGLTVIENGSPNWTGVVRLDESILDWPLKWKKPRRIFTASSGDLFHENLPDEAIDRVFAVMALCPQHTFQVLTKRPERMQKWFEGDGRPRWSSHVYNRAYALSAVHQLSVPAGWPLPNVWLGVSVENQQTADERIPLLLQTPAALRFVSYEPSLGPVDFKGWLHPHFHMGGRRLDWIIAGGESGPGARECHPSWVRGVRDQCQAASVPFFFKQWGEYLPDSQNVAMTEAGRAGAKDWQGIRVGKKVAGAVLDGQEWREFPGSTTPKVKQKERPLNLSR